MFNFAGWNFIGTIASILRDQGGNVIINLFSGPAINAARGIAMQVNNAVNGFVSNFQTALNPQITKSYASGEYKYMMNLIFQGSRLSYYILLLLILPILCNTHFILKLWLGQVPEHTILFTQLILLFSLNESLANPLINVMLATGRIKKFQIIVGGINLLNLPISYVCLNNGCIPEIVIIIAIFISIICQIARIILLKRMIQLSISIYLKKVYLNIIAVSIIASIIPFYIKTTIIEDNFYNFCIISLICIFTTLLSIFYIGCSKSEKSLIIKKIKH